MRGLFQVGVWVVLMVVFGISWVLNRLLGVDSLSSLLGLVMCQIGVV